MKKTVSTVCAVLLGAAAVGAGADDKVRDMECAALERTYLAQIEALKGLAKDPPRDAVDYGSTVNFLLSPLLFMDGMLQASDVHAAEAYQTHAEAMLERAKARSCTWIPA